MTKLTSFTGTIYLGFNFVTLSTRVLKEVNVSIDLCRVLKGVNMSDPRVLKGVNFGDAPFGALERGLIPVSFEVVC